MAGRTKRGIWALEVREEVVGDVLVLDFSGRAGARGAERLAAVLGQAIAGGSRRILCALDDLDYASSPGLRVLDDAAERLRRHGGELLVCGLTGPVAMALELSATPRVFEVAASRAAALGRFNSGTERSPDADNGDVPTHSVPHLVMHAPGTRTP